MGLFKSIGLDIYKKKNPGARQGFAPPLGLEPRTYWLTASRSNLLSYGGLFPPKWDCNISDSHEIMQNIAAKYFF